MVRYLALLNFTDQGIQHLSDSPNRAQHFRDTVQHAGGKMIAQYWALGKYDGCFIFEAPDDTTAAKLLLSLGQKGNVRTRSLRLLDEHEFTQALK